MTETSIPVAEMVSAYLEISMSTGEEMSNHDLAVCLADNASAHGMVDLPDDDDGAAFDLLVAALEREMPYFTGRRK